MNLPKYPDYHIMLKDYIYNIPVLIFQLDHTNQYCIMLSHSLVAENFTHICDRYYPDHTFIDNTMTQSAIIRNRVKAKYTKEIKNGG